MNQERILTIILGPHISEKTSILSEENNQITFKVAVGATKHEVKHAIESLFDVQVKGKTKRSARGKIRSRSDWKKAYIRLEQGQEIDFAELG